jgi:tetratricopeptide (TPR) repeat protein
MLLRNAFTRSICAEGLLPMAGVFLSYDREDAARARVIASALEKAGHSVWWDQHIRGGAQYSKEIDKALKAADAVVVLWSGRSVESAWVRDEAAAGRDSGRLVPVRLDSTDPPLGFRQYQAIDIPRGRISAASSEALLDAVDALARTEPVEDIKRSVLEPRSLRTAPLALIASVLAVLAIAFGAFVLRPWESRGEVIVAVGTATNDPASQALARDLTTRLAGLQSASSGAIRLIEAANGQRPDLLFETSTADASVASASLALKSGKDQAILWSRDFEQPTGRRADLLQQMAYTAARVTGCAMEGLNGKPGLKPATLKIYLNACAQLSEMGTLDHRPPARQLLDVIKAAPRFEPAWSKLLLAEAASVAPQANDGELSPGKISELRRHIGEARRIDAAMPEAAIAEAALLPARDFAGRAERIENAAAQRPDDPVILRHLAASQAETGRTKDAVDALARAVQLDPLSPTLHGNYTAMLAYSGNFEAARRELAKAEKLWPGTASLWDLQYRFHLRYGDPRIARAIFDQQSDSGGRVPRMFLDVRQDPTPAKIEELLTVVRERLRNMENPSSGVGTAVLAFAHFNRTDEALSTLLAWPKADDIGYLAEIFFRPEFREIRRDPRFLMVAHRAGLLDYWRQSGNWPDFCFEPEFPYDCKAEAAKLG